jgi:DGQHR domain-containing protein
MAAATDQTLRRRAILIHQDEDHPLYLFSLTGDELMAVADVSRISRSDAGKLLGYQRPEVKRHVQDIVGYLNGDRVLFPNAIILALSSAVRFTRSRGPENDDGLAAAGILELPLPAARQPKPAWVVDGQQRLLALSKSRRRDFPVPVSAFIADDVELQRDQFLRVNNTQPLPRGLVTELLPEVSTALPTRLAARKLPAALCEWLNTAPASPFRGLIRRASAGRAARDDGVVADTSVVKMVEESLSSTSGCLFPYRNIATGETDGEGICAVLAAYWTAVKRVFPDAWGRPAHQSRLMHGAGIRAMGRLMDRVMAGVNGRDPRAADLAERELRRVASLCRWTAGVWEGLNDLAWNEVQNVPRHVRLLSSFLIRAYLQAKGTTG